MSLLIDEFFPDYVLKAGDVALAAWGLARPHLFEGDEGFGFLWCYAVAELCGILDEVELVLPEPEGLPVDPEPGPRWQVRERRPYGLLRAGGWGRDRPMCRRGRVRG